MKGDGGTEKGISKFCISNRSALLWSRFVVSVEFGKPVHTGVNCESLREEVFLFIENQEMLPSSIFK